MKCSVRKTSLVLTPEEVVRQGWIARLTGELGFPLSLLAVEKELSTLPHLRHLPAAQVPKRRIDIVAFAKRAGTLFPLLLIECKATALNPRFFTQAISYNSLVKAPYVALATPDRILLGRFDEEASLFSFKEGIPSYQTLLQSLDA